MTDLEISAQLSNTDLKQKTLEQLVKDCYLVGIMLEFDFTASVEDFLIDFEKVLIESERSYPGKMEQLSYRINFPEKTYLKLKLNPAINFFKEIAYEFLVFELKKVVKRSNY